MAYEVKDKQVIDSDGKPVKFIRVKGREIRTKDAHTFWAYKAVTDEQRFIDCRFTKDVNPPKEASFTIINPRYNVDLNRLYPCVWVKGYDEFIGFESLKDTLKI